MSILFWFKKCFGFGMFIFSIVCSNFLDLDFFGTFRLSYFINAMVMVDKELATDLSSLDSIKMVSVIHSEKK